ncbi:type II secretion system protein [Pigmentiphaga sp. CHJ604]|uniref:type II secretion system protein n=1 Tax=Pigmentiphaga sp. CHJ604 TaxID=3081984 RepID=UPI0030CBE31C
MRAGRQEGFSYLALLFALAIFGVGLAKIGPLSSQLTRRDAEAELIRTGLEVERAIASYYYSSPGTLPTLPRTWDDLLEDRRFVTMKRHLRRIPFDPVTRTYDWGMEEIGGGMAGIYSRSDAAPLRRRPIELERSTTGGEHYSDWKFVFIPSEAKR